MTSASSWGRSVRSLSMTKRTAVGALALCLSATIGPADAAKFKVLYSFKGTDGSAPWSTPILDATGNLYGTTASGGGSGVVYELEADGTERTVYSFAEGNGGYQPNGVILDSEGNLWGTTSAGGDGNVGCGVVFKITPGGTESDVYSFNGEPNDGCGPFNILTPDGRKYYGTTVVGGRSDNGTVFKITAAGSETLLRSFQAGRDGDYPFAALVLGTHGKLFGTTDYGGKKTDAGTVFEVTRNGNKKVLYAFGGSPSDGAVPAGGVIEDASGNLFGTTMSGGRKGGYLNNGCGIVYELSPNGVETILHFFAGGENDGASPQAGLIEDASGNLYGTTQVGGGRSNCLGAEGCGTVFKIAPDGSETILHKFNEATDGSVPQAGLVSDASGNLYGAALGGGKYGYGTVFEITP